MKKAEREAVFQRGNAIELGRLLRETETARDEARAELARMSDQLGALRSDRARLSARLDDEIAVTTELRQSLARFGVRLSDSDL